MNQPSKPTLLVVLPDGVVRDQFVNPAVVKELEKFTTIVWNDSGAHMTPQTLKARLSDIDICVTGWGCPSFSAEVLSGNPRLKLVIHTGGSVANLVSEELYARGIKVLSGNRMYAESVAEAVLAYMLVGLREIVPYANGVQAGQWRTEELDYRGLFERSLGLVGFGAVAQFLVQMLRPFRMNISVADPFVSDALLAQYGVRRAALEQVVTQNDIVSLHAAQVPATFHMINAELIKRIPDGCLLVNTARGSLIDEAALATELASGRFSAVLDVFEVEPLPMDSGLRNLRNVLLIPHMAGPTADRRFKVMFPLIEDMHHFFQNQPMQNEISMKTALGMTRY